MAAPDFFLIQNDSGTVDGANSYADIDFFVAYCTSRGKSLIDPLTSAQYTDLQIAICLITGCDYMDSRWSWTGEREQINQDTEWPRLSAFDDSGVYISGVTDILRRAQSEYGYIALTSPAALNPTPTRDESGVAVQSKTTQVGPILESIHYAAGAVFTNPTYPSADNILKNRGYTASRTTLIRG